MQQPHPAKARNMASQKYLLVTWKPLAPAKMTGVGKRNLDWKGEADDEFIVTARPPVATRIIVHPV